jgi:DNA polymerase delta subunit 2
VGNISASEFVTGIIASIKGIPLKGGEFQVEDILFPDLPAQIELHRGFSMNYFTLLSGCCSEKSDPPVFVVLVSGLNIGHSNQNPLLIQLFIDFVTGMCGSSKESSFASNIIRVIIAGNSLNDPTKTIEGAALRDHQRVIL